MLNRYIIEGGYPLVGEVDVSGSKNAALPVIAASLLNKGTVELKNCPQIRDVTVMLEILKHLGAKVYDNQQSLFLDTSEITSCVIPENLMHEMRSSVMIAGALIGRKGCAKFTYPGGCEIGSRPINMHLKAFQKMGVEINETNDKIECKVQKLIGTKITLSFPSVGATENMMLASVLAEGETVIHNAAREPEIVCLQNFLNSMGGRICGAGSHTIFVQGVKVLHDTSFEVIPDRIEAGTYLCMVAGCGGEVKLNHVNSNHLQEVIRQLKKMNCQIGVSPKHIFLKSNANLYPTIIKTMPYPGFPTDMQSQFVTALSIAKGTSYVMENIFENRYKYVKELMKMGAQIVVQGKTAMVRGVKKLKNAQIEAKDLRGGAALVEAALMAEGISTITGIPYIERGYENLTKKLTILGAKIKEE